MAAQLGRVLVSAVGGPGARHPGSWLWQGQSLVRALSSSPSSLSAEQPSASTSSQVDSSSSISSPSSSPSSTSSPSASSSPSSSTGSIPDAEGYRVMYQGFFARPHKRLKYASLLNTFASFAAAPLIVTYSSASPIARVAVTVSVITFAIITTGGLHWFTSPYVHQLLYNDKTDTAKVQMLRFFGGTKWHEFPVSAVEAPTGYHPLASFKVSGRTYYLDKANFHDEQLMNRLFVADASSSPSTQDEPASSTPQDGRQ